MIELQPLLHLDKSAQQAELGELNQQLESMSAIERIEWSSEHLPQTAVLSSSFGIQSAVMLHLISELRPDLPVILIDTGYLFAETYAFIDKLTEQLNLDLKIYSSKTSPAWQEARYGQLWTQGVEGIERYNHINKVEPMQRALKGLGAQTWLSGLRRDQSKSRSQLPVLSIQQGCFKLLPLIDWNNRRVHQYLTEHDLPYHPLWDQGYVSVGDIHTSRPLTPGMTEEETRFFGLKRECGLHEDGGGI